MKKNGDKRAAIGRPLLLLALCVVPVIVVFWISSQPSGAPDVVLLITLDTLRLDAIGEDTPVLRGLGTLVTARTTCPLTLPAHVSIFTGLEPPRHGIRDNASPPLPDAADRPFTLLAEEFRDAGYQTVAFVASSVLDKRFGIASGFDRYEPGPALQPGAARFPYLTAEEQVERVRSWAESRPKNRPLFLWVHLFDPHAPYRAFDGDAEHPLGTLETDPPKERYAGEVRRTDAAVGAILDLFDREKTLIVVASDHGESLGEHGEATHGHLVYGATMDVPIIFSGLDEGVVRPYHMPVSITDIAPTLRTLCRLPSRESDGYDLTDLKMTERVVCGESLYAYRLYGWAQQTVATDGGFSLVDGGPVLSLFDRRADPGETSPLSDLHEHAAYAKLDRALQRYRAAAGESGAGALVVGAPTIYGSARMPVAEFLAPKDNRALRSVEAHLASTRLLYEVRQAIDRGPAGRGIVERLLPELEAMERADATNPAPALDRGRALRLLNRTPEAAKAFRTAWRRGYETQGVFKLWVLTLWGMGDRAGVAAAFSEASGKLPPSFLDELKKECR